MVSRSLSNSLASLESVIDKATRKLRKMPGATIARVEVGSDLNPSYAHAYFLSLEMDEKDGDARLAVCDAQDNFERWLDEYPVVTRMRLAREIPALIDAAKAAEPEVEKEVIDIVGEIEQALADL